MTTKSFMRLADLCNRRQKGTCEWIFNTVNLVSVIFDLSTSFGGMMYLVQRSKAFCCSQKATSYTYTQIENNADQINSRRWKDFPRVSQSQNEATLGF
jgi:hypothetical protein